MFNVIFTIIIIFIMLYLVHSIYECFRDLIFIIHDKKNNKKKVVDFNAD